MPRHQRTEPLVVALALIAMSCFLPAASAAATTDLYRASNGTLVLNSDLLLAGQGLLLSELFAQVRANTASIAQLQQGEPLNLLSCSNFLVFFHFLFHFSDVNCQ